MVVEVHAKASLDSSFCSARLFLWLHVTAAALLSFTAPSVCTAPLCLHAISCAHSCIVSWGCVHAVLVVVWHAHFWNYSMCVFVLQSSVSGVGASGYLCTIACGCCCAIMPLWADCMHAALPMIRCITVQFALHDVINTCRCHLYWCTYPPDLVDSFPSLVPGFVMSCPLFFFFSWTFSHIPQCSIMFFVPHCYAFTFPSFSLLLCFTPFLYFFYFFTSSISHCVSPYVSYCFFLSWTCFPDVLWYSTNFHLLSHLLPQILYKLEVVYNVSLS